MLSSSPLLSLVKTDITCYTGLEVDRANCKNRASYDRSALPLQPTVQRLIAKDGGEPLATDTLAQGSTFPTHSGSYTGNLTHGLEKVCTLRFS